MYYVYELMMHHVTKLNREKSVKTIYFTIYYYR